MSAGSTERRQRIRAQLREFYGDPAGGRVPSNPHNSQTSSNNTSATRVAVGAAATAAAPSGIPPEMDLDSEFFNVNRYITDLLRRESLKGLVETDTQLLRSVRHLDGELQELVYRNYAKFISATDTIREMRDNITEMDAKLQALSSNVENIDQVSKNISDKLQAHRSRIEDMISTNRMLRKVQFLVDLADTMRRLMDKKEYTTCVKYWVIGETFLEKYEHVPSIAKIHSECKLIAQQLYNNLHDMVFTASLDDPEAMDVIRGVVENMRLMRATSLFPKEEIIKKNIKGGVDASSSSSGGDEGKNKLSPFEIDILNTLMKNIGTSFATGVQGVNSAIRAAFAIPNFTSMDITERAKVLHDANLREALAELKSICALFYSNSERVYSLFNNESDTVASLRVIEEVQPVLIDIITLITNHLSELLIAVIESVAEDGESSMQIPSCIKNGYEVIFSALAKHLKYYSGTLKTLGVNYLDNAHSNQSRQYGVLVDQSVLEVFQRLLTVLDSKMTEGVMMNSTIVNCDVEKNENYKQLLYFALTRFAFSSAATSIDTIGITNLINTDTLKTVDVVGIQKHSAHIARSLAHRGVVLLGQLQLEWIAASSCPANAVDPTSTAAENYGVAPVLCSLIQQLGKIYTVLHDGVLLDTSTAKERPVNSMRGGSLLLTSTGGSGRSSGRVSSSKLTVNFTRQNDHTLQSSVDRIFLKQSQHSATLRTSPRLLRATSVMSAVVVYILKGLVEYVRQQTFTRQGFQTVQISCTFFLHVLTPASTAASSSSLSSTSAINKRDYSPSSFLGEDWMSECAEENISKTVSYLLNECCTCAYERCKEKSPLTSVVIDRLVKSALDKMKEKSTAA
ncbi:Vps51/Vps67 protein [Trypanosoma theileri]|uniref:Vacuolar protein sorting-associated protein 51 homolog n=1 Tax=Trypanosoma theileri TaxID=67003 RepID=A0A1X0NYZ3_9TRYP|nr:Vps51/Vps67 protein [Trypanosoma theileri]ORC89370.1 Vps51/Vps67 protein [Trypanosoma theileri]